jgi:hypothetical protein
VNIVMRFYDTEKMGDIFFYRLRDSHLFKKDSISWSYMVRQDKLYHCS